MPYAVWRGRSPRPSGTASVSSVEARRIIIYGTTGSGKSTLARRLGAITGLPVIGVDDLTWYAGWTPMPKDEQRQLMSRICAGDAWILDHGYGQWLDIARARAQLIVCLDYPRWLSLGRLLRRTAGRIIRRTPVCNGNRETIRRSLARDSIIWWHFKSWSRKRNRMRAWYAASRSDEDGPQVLLFSRQSEVDRWLAGQRAGAVRAG